MRAVLLLALVAVAAAEIAEPWVEEEDLAETDYKDDHDRQKRQAHVEGPYEEHVRIKRGHEEGHSEPHAAKRTVRNPRQVHQYEVHEFIDDRAMPSPPYEQMLASSAEHYHMVHPGSPRSFTGPHTFGAPAPVRAAQPAVAPASVTSFAAPNPHAYQAPAPVLSAAARAPALSAAAPLSAAPVVVAEDSLHAAGHNNAYTHGYSGGGGQDRHGKHYAEHGGKHSEGSNSNQYSDKGNKGFKIDEVHRKEYEDAGGIKKKHHDRADHKGDHEEEAFGLRGAEFGERKAHKKGHKTKGFHNKYHKDESHKEHKFYDDFHKDGEHHRYGKFNARHASNESGKKKVHHVNAGHDFTEHGKKGYSNKGHLDADNKGYRGKDGHEEHHHHHSQHAKKDGKKGHSHWGYAKKH